MEMKCDKNFHWRCEKRICEQSVNIRKNACFGGTELKFNLISVAVARRSARRPDSAMITSGPV